MRKSLFFFLGFLIPIMSNAQKTSSIRGVLVDSEKKTKIGYATVSVYNSTDSVLVNYKLSDPKGAFAVNALPTGKFRLIVTAWQYVDLDKEVIISADESTINLDTLVLTPLKNNLQQVTIFGQRPPIIVRNDTVEFNAESFKTLPTAVVEDLLKKLPGVVITSNNEITYKGRIINRILVDGKEFFGSDTQIASKNLPSNIVDKVQIMDDSDFKRRNPDLITGDIPQVINLTLKRGVKQGAFGKIYAGAGPRKFFEFGGIINVFRDTTQVSVLGFGNNINKSAFSLIDVKRIGGFERGGYGSVRTEDGGYSIDNVSFGGTGNGIQKIFGGGVNLNHQFKNGVKFNAKYFYGQNTTMIEQLTNETQTLPSRTLNVFSNVKNDNSINSHNVGARIEINSSPTFQLNIIPTIEITPRSFSNAQRKITGEAGGANLSIADFSNNRDGLVASYRLNSSLYRDFKKKGRRLFVGASFVKTNNDEDNFNYSNSFYNSTNSSTVLDQLRENNLSSLATQINTSFSEPISKTVKITGEFLGNVFDNKNFLATFYKNSANQAYDIIIPNLSETVRQNGLKTTSTARLSWNINKNLTIQPTLIFGTIHIQNSFEKYADFTQNFTFLNPGVNIRYKFFSVEYQRSFTEPSVQYLQPVANNTDPFFIQLGNTSLLPSKTHRIFMFYNKFDMKRSMSYNLNLNASNEDNAIVMAKVIDGNGVQVNRPINVNGVRQVSNGGSISRSFKSTSNQLTLNLGYSASFFNSPIEVNNIRSSFNRFFFTPTAGLRLNFNDKVELFENYYLSYSKSTYQDKHFTDLSVVTHGSDSEVILRLHKKFVFETNLKLLLNNQDLSGYNNTIKLLNMGLTYVFMKNDMAQLKFSVNDLLQSNAKRYVSISENFIRDSQINNIGRYGLLTFTYNIRDLKQKVGGKERFLNF